MGTGKLKITDRSKRSDSCEFEEGRRKANEEASTAGGCLEKERLPTFKFRFGIILGLTFFGATACAVKRTTRISPVQAPLPALTASAAELASHLNAESGAIHTFTASVDLEPTAGSIYSGVIKEYHDVRGFILVEKPAMIRMIGQAPIVRTDLFDMTSDGKMFRLYLPTKQKFIVGNTEFHRPAKNQLENLRPQHILEALLIPGIDLAQEKFVLEEAEEKGHDYYVITLLASGLGSEFIPKRKIWFDRSDLEITRLQMYGSQGAYLEDVRYSAYRDFQGVRYPQHIEVTRPVEDYRLGISILKATFNQPIAPEKFDLKKPQNAQLVELGALAPPEGTSGQ